MRCEARRPGAVGACVEHGDEAGKGGLFDAQELPGGRWVPPKKRSTHCLGPLEAWGGEHLPARVYVLRLSAPLTFCSYQAFFSSFVFLSFFGIRFVVTALLI